MAIDPSSESDVSGSADDGNCGAGDSRARSANGDAARTSVKSPAGIAANSEELLVGGTDLAAARQVLSELGARGSDALDALSVHETIDLISGLEGLSTAMSALQARALVHLEAAVKADCLRREESPKAAVKIARSEASRALKRSRSSAGQTMSSCRRLVQSMPGMLTELASGRVTADAAHRVGRVMAPATPEQRGQIDELLTERLPYLEDCGTEEIVGEAERLLHGLDPEGAAARHRIAKRERSVSVRRTAHGMSTLTANLTGLDGARIRKGLSIAAEKARAHGDRRGHQQIMSDLLADALIGRGDGLDPCTLDIGVIITDRSLFAPAHADAATIEGFGPVPYEHIREEMHAAMQTAMQAEEDSDLALTLRRLYLDPDAGELVAVESRSRAFPPSLARFLRLRHQTCRAPHCDANIRQNDHIVPWSQGGPTSLENGNGLCAGDNQKEESGETARVIRDEDGTRRTVEWTTRYGQKARRPATNFDPYGTALRRQTKKHLQGASELLGRGAPEPERREAPALESRGEPERIRRGLEEKPAEQNDSLRRAFERIDRKILDRAESHPVSASASRTATWLRRQRRDYVFDSSTVIVSPTPWGSA